MRIIGSSRREKQASLSKTKAPQIARIKPVRTALKFSLALKGQQHRAQGWLQQTQPTQVAPQQRCGCFPASPSSPICGVKGYSIRRPPPGFGIRYRDGLRKAVRAGIRNRTFSSGISRITNLHDYARNYRIVKSVESVEFWL